LWGCAIQEKEEKQKKKKNRNKRFSRNKRYLFQKQYICMICTILGISDNTGNIFRHYWEL